jgi:methylenetetrahydrofolate reductase (NADPH)
MPSAAFQIICEVEPATRPSWASIRHQVGVLEPVTSAFLIPDNHLGQATVSSIAAAHEVAAMGAHPIACINSRDRNLLGFKRDLLTAGACGVTDLLFVFGDRPASGARSHDLNVASMLAEARTVNEANDGEFAPFVVGVTSRLGALPTWKSAADTLFVQAGFDIDGLLAWRASLDFAGPVYAGVLVLASVKMAKSVMAATDEISVPENLLDRLSDDPAAGVEFAIDQISSIEANGAFDGVHLIPVGRYRQVAARLAERGARERTTKS